MDEPFQRRTSASCLWRVLTGDWIIGRTQFLGEQKLFIENCSAMEAGKKHNSHTRTCTRAHSAMWQDSNGILFGSRASIVCRLTLAARTSFGCFHLKFD